MAPERDYLSGVDAIFLRLADSTNRMLIASVWDFPKPVTKQQAVEQLNAFVDQFPRFRRRLRGGDSLFEGWWFEDYDGFRVEDHISMQTLPAPGNAEQLRQAAGKCMSEPLDHDRALFHVHLIDGLENGGGAMVFRLHHCITDGQGSIRALLALTKNNIDGQSSGEEREQKQYGKAAPAAKKDKRDANILRQLGVVLVTFLLNVLGFFYVLFHMAQVTLYQRKSLRVQLPATEQKEIAWSEELSLDDVKFVKNAFGATVNDVLVAALAGAIHNSVTQSGGPVDEEILLMIPVSMRRPEDWSLTNKATIAFLKLKAEAAVKGEKDHAAGLQILNAKVAMKALKTSLEPLLGFTLMHVPLLREAILSVPCMRWFMDKAYGILTNVPGPAEKLTFCGQTIESYRPIVPQTGPGSLGIGILSYAGKVSVTIMSDLREDERDKQGIPFGGVRGLVKEFNLEFHRLLEAAKALQADATAQQ